MHLKLNIGIQMVALRISNDFAKEAHQLPKETREKLTKVFFLLTSDPRHPSLQVKKIKGAKRDDIYECRIDQSWRMVLRDMGQMQYDLISIGEHDKTISFGKSLDGSIIAGLTGGAWLAGGPSIIVAAFAGLELLGALGGLVGGLAGGLVGGLTGGLVGGLTGGLVEGLVAWLVIKKRCN
ncbi:type II toxin-antitoxin system RelE family toxin [Thiofilum flexile]|uniref:type II toxin-antitoxin system RelE family toxin n=1 Tax=Thiofilum flexile TaxID=125627 RepID=UPI00037A1EB7|nr:hypothetical protein [Thiofilum flexile]